MSCSFLYFFRLAAYSDSLLSSNTFSPGKEDVGRADMQKHSHLAWKSPLWVASWWMRAEGQVGWAPARQRTTAHCPTYLQAADAHLTKFYLIVLVVAGACTVASVCTGGEITRRTRAGPQRALAAVLHRRR